MKVEFKVPKGWRRLKDDEIIKALDRFECNTDWDIVCGSIGQTPKQAYLPFVIRRIKKKVRKG